ncbi:MAG: hypothetical protein EA343_10725 [Nodularia sp. (in: Bacteria)]|nr:MAG: hypothetical protein EA343_10725 [Nodularia sp. (in: cyanobacteria)]
MNNLNIIFPHFLPFTTNLKKIFQVVFFNLGLRRNVRAAHTAKAHSRSVSPWEKNAKEEEEEEVFLNI